MTDTTPVARQPLPADLPLSPASESHKDNTIKSNQDPTDGSPESTASTESSIPQQASKFTTTTSGVHSRTSDLRLSSASTTSLAASVSSSINANTPPIHIAQGSASSSSTRKGLHEDSASIGTIQSSASTTQQEGSSCTSTGKHLTSKTSMATMGSNSAYTSSSQTSDFQPHKNNPSRTHTGLSSTSKDSQMLLASDVTSHENEPETVLQSIMTAMKSTKMLKYLKGMNGIIVLACAVATLVLGTLGYVIAKKDIEFDIWTSHNDARDSCRNDLASNITSTWCQKALAKGVQPPPKERRSLVETMSSVLGVEKVFSKAVPLAIFPLSICLGAQALQYLEWHDRASRKGKGAGRFSQLKLFLSRAIVVLLAPTLIYAAVSLVIVGWHKPASMSQEPEIVWEFMA